MVTYKRTDCRLCESKGLQNVLELKPIPLSENYSSDRETALSRAKFPLTICQCVDCGHVQLIDIIDTRTLWDSYSYLTSNSHGMVAHFSSIATNLLRFNQKNVAEPWLAVDIGSNDGTFLKLMKEKGASVIGVDPAESVAKEAISRGIPTLITVFDEEAVCEIVKNFGLADVVTAFNVFAHADDLQEFTKNIVRLLKPEGIFVFEAQYLLDILEKDLIASFFHEHMSHHSITSLSPFLHRFGLNLFHVERFPIQHGSIVGYCDRSGSHNISQSLLKLSDLEHEINISNPSSMLGLASRLESNLEVVQNYLSNKVNQGFRIVGYGAARSGPTLIIQFGLGQILEFVVDDDPKKHNLFETGAGLRIYPSSKLLDVPRTVAVILAWVHADNIIASNFEFLKSGGEFLVISPTPFYANSQGRFDL